MLVVEPMLLKTAQEVPRESGWAFEAKYDGYSGDHLLVGRGTAPATRQDPLDSADPNPPQASDPCCITADRLLRYQPIFLTCPSEWIVLREDGWVGLTHAI
jgi:hypothetical protein